MLTPFRLALAAALIALSTVAHAEKVTLVCEPDGNQMSPFTVDIDYDRSSAIFTGGTTLPARITEKEITWVIKNGDFVDTVTLNRTTGRLTQAYSGMGRVGASFFRCSRAKQQF